MRFVKPQAGSVTREGHRPRPDWLTEWIANKGRYVRLKCGDNEDLNWRGLIILAGFDKRITVLCPRCNAWSDVVKEISLREYRRMPPEEYPNDPLF